MKKLAFVLLAAACFATPSFAQAPEQGTAPAAAQAGGKGAVMKEAMQACRKQATAQGVSQGKAMQQAVKDCIIKDHPGMGKMLNCRTEGVDKGMKPGTPELKSFVKDCVRKANAT